MRLAQTGNRGFTLIEMLVALSIFASLMSVLMLGFSQGLSMWGRGDDRAAIWQSLEHRYGMLSRLFAQTQVAVYTQEESAYSPYFKGTPRRLQFVSRAPLFDPVGAVRVVALSIEPQSNNKFALRYREASSRSDPARGIEWDDSGTVSLLDNLQRARFRYEAPVFPLPSELDPLFMKNKDKQRYRSNPQWLQSFDGDSMWRTPQRVELEFVDEGGMQQQWTFVLASAADAWTLEVYSDE